MVDRVCLLGSKSGQLQTHSEKMGPAWWVSGRGWELDHRKEPAVPGTLVVRGFVNRMRGVDNPKAGSLLP